MEGEKPRAGQLGTALVAVEVPEDLVSTTDRERGSAAGDGLPQCATHLGQRRGDQLLLAILAAPNVEEIVRAGPDLGTCSEREHLELMAPPGGPALQNRHVPTIGVDVEVVGEEVADDDLHAAASQ